MDKDVYKGWMDRYNAIKAIKSPVQYDVNRKKRKPLEAGVFESFIKDITEALIQSDLYLDYHGHHMPKPLWQYNPDDPTTHLSSPHFAYHHLLG